jgi:hypothetical protein
MGDWDFLHEMEELGYSADEISAAMASGIAPWDTYYISNEWIDAELENEAKDKDLSDTPHIPFKSRDGFPFSTLEQINVFDDLVNCAIRHFENTGRYLQIWGELGEIYAEINFGLRRHGTHQAGSDGTIEGKLVEVKTISPEKIREYVMIKSQGNFEQVLIVRITKDFEFQGKLIDRSELKGSTGKFLKGQFKDSH